MNKNNTNIVIIMFHILLLIVLLIFSSCKCNMCSNYKHNYKPAPDYISDTTDLNDSSWY